MTHMYVVPIFFICDGCLCIFVYVYAYVRACWCVQCVVVTGGSGGGGGEMSLIGNPIIAFPNSNL